MVFSNLKLCAIVTLTAIAAISCNKGTSSSDQSGSSDAQTTNQENTVEDLSKKEMKSFQILGIDSEASIDEETISLEIPDVSLKDLVPSFKFEGLQVKIGNEIQESGVTKVDFTNSAKTPIIYTVEAKDGSKRDYNVTVSIQKSELNNLISFTVKDNDSIVNAGINENPTNSTISASLNYSKDGNVAGLPVTLIGYSPKVDLVLADGTLIPLNTKETGKETIDGKNVKRYTTKYKNPSLKTYSLYSYSESSVVKKYGVSVERVATNSLKVLKNFQINKKFEAKIDLGTKVANLDLPYQYPLNDAILSFQIDGKEVQITNTNKVIVSGSKENLSGQKSIALSVIPFDGSNPAIYTINLNVSTVVPPNRVGELQPPVGFRCGDSIGGSACAVERENALKSGCIYKNEYDFLEKKNAYPICGSKDNLLATCTCGCFEKDTKIYAVNKETNISAYESITNILSKKSSFSVVGLSDDSTLSFMKTKKFEIFNTTTGPEEDALFAFTTENGQRLAVTKKHAILLSSGVMVQADNVKLSDKLVLADGKPVAITKIDRVKTSDDVLNILTNGESPIEHTLIAEGIVVGDLAWQNNLKTMLNSIAIRE